MLRVARLALVLVAALAAACGDDLTQINQQWVQAQVDEAGKLVKAQELADYVKAKVEAVPASVPTKAELQAKLAEHSRKLADAQAAFAKARNDVAEAMKTGKLANVLPAVEKAKKTVEESAGALMTGLGELGKRAEELKLAVEKEAAEQAMVAKMSKEGGSFGDQDLVFAPGTADLDLAKPSSRAAFDVLTRVAKACDAIQLELVGHVSRQADAKKAQKLSEARAAAVRDALLKAGVDAKRLAKPAGKGATQPLIAEPAPGSKEEKTIPAALLARQKAQNERIVVNVLKKCP